MKKAKIISIFILVAAMLATSIAPIIASAEEIEEIQEGFTAETQEITEESSMEENIVNDEQAGEMSEEAGVNNEDMNIDANFPSTESDNTNTDMSVENEVQENITEDNEGPQVTTKIETADKNIPENTDENVITAIKEIQNTRMVIEYKPALNVLLERFPKAITIYHGENSEDIDINWICNGDYNQFMGEYPFVPDLSDYTLAEDVSLPCIIVTFENEVGGPVGVYTTEPLCYEVPLMPAGRRLAKNGPSQAMYNGYEENNLSAVKDQGLNETCWAFSAIGAIESDLITSGVMTNPDLSELQIAYFAGNEYQDPKDCYTYKINNITSEPDVWLKNGGTFKGVAELMANLVGAIPEDDAPYAEGASFAPDDTFITSKDIVQLRNAYFINTSDMAEIKKAVLAHGGVAMSYNETKSEDDYNGDNNAYYCTQTGHNHAAMIVGWDDNFSKDCFTNTPEGDGAWLVKNSWGYEGYGHFGYFWMSYYDAGFNSTEVVAAFDVTKDNLYQHCYSYDGTPIGDALFDVSATRPVRVIYNISGGEAIKGVGFEINTANVTATVNITNKTTNETAMSVVHTTYAGIYTAELDEAMEIPIDSEIEVSITFAADAGGNVTVVGEIPEPISFNKLNYIGTLDKGCKIGDTNCSCDARIKIYTNDSDNAHLIPVTGVTIEPDSASIAVGETVTLKEVVFPETVANKTVTWSSDDESVATVSSDGIVTGVAPGDAIITVTTDSGEKTATCDITVTPIAVTGVSLNRAKGSINTGENITLFPTISPSNATNKAVTWSSDNTDIAIVSETGLVTGMGAGTARITVKTVDGEKTATCTVTVKSTLVNRVTLNRTSGDVVIGKTIAISPTVSPATALNRRLTWKSSDASVATVASGVVKGVAVGTATITCTATDGSGVSAACIINVKPALVTGITLNIKNTSLVKGTTISLKPTITPKNATKQSVTWSSSNKDIATVSKNGVVTGVSGGTASITCSSTDGSGKSAVCKVTVTIPATSIKLNKTTTTIVRGKTITLKPTISPTNTSNKNVSWKTSNKNIATVDKNGIVKGVKRGTATITCTANDGSGKYATCKIIVKEPIAVKNVTLDKTSTTLTKGKKKLLKATVTPSNATNKGVVWKSSNEKVVTVDKDGVIRGIKRGTATITVTTKDGNKTAKCKVTVKNP